MTTLNIEELLYSNSIWESVLGEMWVRKVEPETVARITMLDYRYDICNKLITGSYKFNPPKLVHIPKDDGTLRDLLILEDQDRIVMQVLYKIYYSLYKSNIHSSCMSYQTGVSVKDIAVQIRNGLKSELQRYKLDISKYFDSVPQDVINRELNNMDPTSGPTVSLYNFYNDNRIIVHGKEVEHFKSLCQGCSFSALLANVILYDIDEYLSAHADMYIRYSDDMYIQDANVNALIVKAKEMLAHKGLILKDSKVQQLATSFDFVGVHISPTRLSIGKKGLRNICNNIKQKLKNKTSLERAIRAVQSYLLSSDTNGYSALSYWFNICTNVDDIIKLDRMIKDEIRYHFTNKHNIVHNIHQLPNQAFKESGWVSLEYLYRLYKHDKNAYKAYSAYILHKYMLTPSKIRSYMTIDKISSDLLKFWETAKYAKHSPFITYEKPLDVDFNISSYESNTAREYMCNIIKNATIDFGEDKFIKVTDELFLFKDWF